MPEIFPAIRVLVDQNRKPGRFLLFGSASPDLRRQSTESLAGRIITLELTPFLLQKINSKADSLDIGATTAGRYLDAIQQTLLVRRLQPFHKNLGKRLIKSPKVYIRDTGLLHALLGLKGREQLPGHPVRGEITS